MKKENEPTVVIGDGVITVRRKGSTTIAVANILGTKSSGTEERIYLDRMVHRAFEDEMGEYRVTGAVSSILHREIPDKGNAVSTQNLSPTL